MSNYRKAVRRRAHPERAQPSSRQHMGLLEKHSDYVLRARNYHSKQDRLNSLREAARLRNPDEFYHRMERDGEGVKDGRHVIERKGVKRSAAQLKRMKEQDFNYAVMQQQHEQHRIERISHSLQGLGDSLPSPPPRSGPTAAGDDEEGDEDDNDDDEGEESSPPNSSQRRHVIFTDATPPSSFSPAAHFQTEASLVGRAYNRPTLAQLSAGPLTVNVGTEVSIAGVEKERQRTYRSWRRWWRGRRRWTRRCSGC